MMNFKFEIIHIEIKRHTSSKYFLNAYIRTAGCAYAYKTTYINYIAQFIVYVLT